MVSSPKPTYLVLPAGASCVALSSRPLCVLQSHHRHLRSERNRAVLVGAPTPHPASSENSAYLLGPILVRKPSNNSYGAHAFCCATLALRAWDLRDLRAASMVPPRTAPGSSSGQASRNSLFNSSAPASPACAPPPSTSMPSAASPSSEFLSLSSPASLRSNLPMPPTPL